MITEKAFAKINLTLSVGQKRNDGYHDIDSVMHSISLCDEITLTEATEISFAVKRGTAPEGKDNLMWAAAELFFKETGFSGGVHMELMKQIPSEAGMGGGSSDAAAVLRGLNQMTGSVLSLSELAALGARLGADVPFCVAGGCCRCEGIGEILTPIEGWDSLPLVIVRPPISISTAKAYGILDGIFCRNPDTAEDCIQALRNKDRTALLASLSNDFEDVLFKAEPVLGETFSYLSSLCKKAMMTGSGSAFFLMVENEVQQRKLAAKIKEERPQWYVGTAETIL